MEKTEVFRAEFLAQLLRNTMRLIDGIADSEKK